MKMTKTDHALAVFKAGIAAVPGIGSPLAVLIQEYVPSATERSTRQAVDMLKLRLEMLSGRLDCDTVDRDEFSELFKACYLSVLKSHHEAKLKAATGLLVNILLRKNDPAKASFTELDHFARCLDSLSLGAYDLLGYLVAYYRRQPPALQSRVFRMSIDTILEETTYKDAELLMGILGELNFMNLVHLAGIPSIREPNYGNYPVELTQLGIRFVDTVMELGGPNSTVT